MKRQNSIRIDISREEIEKCVKNTFKKEHADEMAECVMTIVEKEDNLVVLFKAASGIIPKQEYAPGDIVIVHENGVDSWRWDSKKMKDSGRLSEQHVICKVKEFNKYAEHPYTVAFEYLEEGDDDTLQSTTSEVSSKHIAGYAEEFPGD